jgi:hypothetical protein
MSKSTISTFELFAMFPDQEAARKYLESRLWPNGPRCPIKNAAADADMVCRPFMTHTGRRAVIRYSITSSVMARSCGGTSMPSNLAVCRLMTNWNLTACTTGKSAGLAPLRMLPV